MRFRLILLMSLITISMLGAQSISQQQEIPVEVYIGTPIRLHVDITSTVGDSIYAPMIDTVGVFHILDRQIAEDRDGQQQLTGIDLTIAASEPGEHTFPPLEFSLKTVAGNLEKLRTEPFEIGVRSMLADSSNVVRDIAEPLMIYPGFWDIFLPIFALALLITGLIFLIRYLKRRPQKEALPIKLKDTRPAFVIALELLETLRVKKLPDHGQFLEYYFEITMILRFFIERYYGIKAMEMTTREIREALVLKDHSEKSEILHFLDGADRIKYAKGQSSYKECAGSEKWLEDYLKSFEHRQKEQREEEAKDV